MFGRAETLGYLYVTALSQITSIVKHPITVTWAFQFHYNKSISYAATTIDICLPKRAIESMSSLSSSKFLTFILSLFDSGMPKISTEAAVLSLCFYALTLSDNACFTTLPRSSEIFLDKA